MPIDSAAAVHSTFWSKTKNICGRLFLPNNVAFENSASRFQLNLPLEFSLNAPILPPFLFLDDSRFHAG